MIIAPKPRLKVNEKYTLKESPDSQEIIGVYVGETKLHGRMHVFNDGVRYILLPGAHLVQLGSIITHDESFYCSPLFFTVNVEDIKQATKKGIKNNLLSSLEVLAA